MSEEIAWLSAGELIARHEDGSLSPVEAARRPALAAGGD